MASFHAYLGNWYNIGTNVFSISSVLSWNQFHLTSVVFTNVQLFQRVFYCCTGQHCLQCRQVQEWRSCINKPALVMRWNWVCLMEYGILNTMVPIWDNIWQAIPYIMCWWTNLFYIWNTATKVVALYSVWVWFTLVTWSGPTLVDPVCHLSI